MVRPHPGALLSKHKEGARARAPDDEAGPPGQKRGPGGHAPRPLPVIFQKRGAELGCRAGAATRDGRRRGRRGTPSVLASMAGRDPGEEMKRVELKRCAHAGAGDMPPWGDSS